jgi:hypothetical protein
MAFLFLGFSQNFNISCYYCSINLGTNMTATTLKKHVRYVTDAKGKATDIIISLKNKEVREYIEDLMDTQEAMTRDDGQGRPFDEFVAEYLSQKTNL